MRRNLFSRLTASALALSLLALPAAQALTPSQAGTLLERYYVDDVPLAVLEKETIPEMLETLGDPYTEYFTPQEYSDFLASMSDTRLVGIGISYLNLEDGLHVSEVFSGSPAQQGGLQAGDIIIAVEGVSVVGESTEFSSGLIQGEEGTDVSVTFLRDGKERTVTLQRAQVTVPATTGELIDGHIGYIRCTTFGQETVGHFEELIDQMEGDATVWIVDLQSNSGGITNAAADAAGLFAGRGEMVYFRDGQDQYSCVRHEENSRTLYPVIVLVDGLTASASEIFASAIREYGCGIVVGTRTFGKGVAQSVLDKDSMPLFFPDGDALKITSYRFFSPDGNSTDQVGVIPDLLVPADYTADVAYLLAGEDPGKDNSNTLRADLGVDFPWRWFIDLDTASSDEYKDTFEVLLSAIPSTMNLSLGTGAAEGWVRTSHEEVAERCGVSYTEPEFNDHGDTRHGSALSILKTYGLIHGTDDGGFHPQDSLTRAELCQMLAVALNCTVPTNPCPFTDVPEDAWYRDAVTAMSNMGLVQGMGDGTFHPGDPIDHQQFITVMGRLGQKLNRHLYDTASTAPEPLKYIVGVMEYEPWAQLSVWLLCYGQQDILGRTINFLWDDSDKIEPTAPTTRDEAAYTFYRLLSYTGILPA